MKYQSALELVGNTPLLELKKIKKKYNLKGDVYAKIEGYNLTGSIKDRIALSMILKAEEEGLLKDGSTIIEPTSGNTGIGLAAIGTLKGYKVIIVMPSSMSKERIKIMEAYGAKVILVDYILGMQGCVDKAKELKEEIENSIILDQFSNLANPLVHYLTTAKEVDRDLNKVDVFISGIGTGGTISGVGSYLKEKNPSTRVIGIEPLRSPLITSGKVGSHAIQGIGANFIPKTLNQDIIDEIELVSDEEALFYAKEMMLIEGVSVGISSGAALKVAVSLAKENIGNYVIIFPDTGSRYYSTSLFE